MKLKSPKKVYVLQDVSAEELAAIRAGLPLLKGKHAGVGAMLAKQIDDGLAGKDAEDGDDRQTELALDDDAGDPEPAAPAKPAGKKRGARSDR